MAMITRAELRLALTTGLLNGLTSLSTIPFGFYAPMAVLAVGSGGYGNSLELGRQRILGSILGMVVLLISLRGLAALPLPLGLAIALAGLRLLGGLLGLRVGYKVGGMIVVMGWLAHGEQLDAWVPLRLVWTVIGILVALLSVRLLWPTRGWADGQAALAELFAGLATDLEGQAGPLATPSRAELSAALEARQRLLQRLRAQLPALATELGLQPLRHPAYRLLETLEEAGSVLVGVCRDLAVQPRWRDVELSPLQGGEGALLLALAERLRLWSRRLAAAQAALPAAPARTFQAPSAWLAIEEHFSHPRLNSLPPRRLQRCAARLTLCSQALLAIETAEQGWAALGHGPSSPMVSHLSSRLSGDRSPPAG